MNQNDNDFLENSERFTHELKTFEALRAQLSQSRVVNSFDEYGFCLGEEKIDLLLSCLIHGDETVGLEAINHVLKYILANPEFVKINLGVLLGNVPAGHLGTRYVEADLNRCFLSSSNQSREHLRAQEISKCLLNSRLVFDFHQTSEPSSQAFFVVTHDNELIRMARQFSLEFPILTEPVGGFSATGKTLTEFCYHHKIPSLAVEWGQKGFSEAQSKLCFDFVLKAISKLQNPNENEIPELSRDPQSIEVWQIKHTIENTPGTELVSGLINCMKVHQGQKIGLRNGVPLNAPEDGLLFFPVYRKLAIPSPELGRIAVRTSFSF